MFQQLSRFIDHLNAWLYFKVSSQTYTERIVINNYYQENLHAHRFLSFFLHNYTRLK